MITRKEQKEGRNRAADMIREAGIYITDKEADSIEVVDFGLSQLEREGLQVVTLVQTERISVKVLALIPNQTEPEHWHPPGRRRSRQGGDHPRRRRLHVFLCPG